ncbi:CREB-regulated transcription coactivator 3-like isoform X2 [Colias croceus]|uniref:CREB-regulated transcription coactivator 3-like isoform X2 n=1 Tax=Colias crocea TaxID=72248 RepID=UPI001E27AA79|nr:CREB-regulated transcription coactivator 3-like isoform X2 [Colias croceus]
MANPRKFSEKIALHNQKQAEETAAFEKIMREVSDATNKVNSNSRRTRVKATTELVENVEPQIVQSQQTMGSFRSGSLPNVAAPQPPSTQPEIIKPEESTIPTQYAMSGGRSGGMSPSPRSPGQRGRASSSVGPMRRPADRKHDTSPYGSTVYLSPPPDSNWRRTNSDSALHQSCGEQQVTAPPLSPHHPLHSHAHPHLHPHQNHRRAANMHLDVLATLGMNPTNRPRSSCEIPRIPNNNNVYESGGDGGGGGGGGGGGKGGGLACELQVPGGSLPDLTSVHFPPPHLPHYLPHRASPDYHHHRYSPSSAGASPGGGSVSPATGGLSPASGSPVGATVPLPVHAPEHNMYDTQNMSPLDHGWLASSYQSHCSPPSQYSSASNINLPSPTMAHSPGSPVGESSQTDYNNLHTVLLQPFEQITMLDPPTSNYNTTYVNHSSPHSPQTTNSQHTYSRATGAQPTGSMHMAHGSLTHSQSHSHPHPHQQHQHQHPHQQHQQHQHQHQHQHVEETRRARDPVAGGGYPLQPLASPSQPATPASIPDIILTDYSGELDAGIFGGEEAQLRAGLDLDDLTLLEEPSALLPDSAVEHEFRLDRLDRL